MILEKAYWLFIVAPVLLVVMWIVIHSLWYDQAQGCAIVFSFFFSFVIFVMLCSLAIARDGGHYVNSPLKSWFDSLASKKGPCCSDADGFALSDVEWQSKNGHYQVLLEGQWHDVPDDALVTVPNLYGRTMVWPIKILGSITIRCFMPGSMT